jgi:hypothetical protein
MNDKIWRLIVFIQEKNFSSTELLHELVHDPVSVGGHSSVDRREVERGMRTEVEPRDNSNEVVTLNQRSTFVSAPNSEGKADEISKKRKS